MIAARLLRFLSVPFYLKEVAYGDTIRIKMHPAGYREFDSVLQRSGSSVYRLMLHDLSRLEEVQERLLDFGVLLERDGELIAIAAPPDVDSDALVDYIIEGKTFWSLGDHKMDTSQTD